MFDELAERITEVTAALPVQSSSRLGRFCTRFAAALQPRSAGTHERSQDDPVAALVQDLAGLIDDPLQYLSDATQRHLLAQAEAYGRQAGREARGECLRQAVQRLHVDLLALAKGRAAVAGAVAGEESDPAAPPSRQLLAPSAQSSVPAAEVTHPQEGEEVLGEVRLRVGWLSQAANRQVLRRYHDGHGNAVLWVDGRTDRSRAIEAALARNNRQVAALAESRWQYVLSRLASSVTADERQFKALNTNTSCPAEGFEGVPVLYDAQTGKNQRKQRTYFTMGRADGVFEAADRLRYGLAPETSVVLLLGRCTKHVAADMIGLFRQYRRRSDLLQAVNL